MTDGKGEAGRNGTLRVAAIGDLHVKEDGSSSFRETSGSHVRRISESTKPVARGFSY